jgi:hypothetical protein
VHFEPIFDQGNTMRDAKNPQYKLLPIMGINLDVANPRIAEWIEMYEDKITSEPMSMALGAAI